MTGKTEARAVAIHNARLNSELSLDRQGFQLVRHETAVHDFYDRVEVEKVYYPEIEGLLKNVTAASKVVIFDHQVRNVELSRQGERNARECSNCAQRLHGKVGSAPRKRSSLDNRSS